jgi:hypothetical protein
MTIAINRFTHVLTQVGLSQGKKILSPPLSWLGRTLTLACAGAQTAKGLLASAKTPQHRSQRTLEIRPGMKPGGKPNHSAASWVRAEQPMTPETLQQLLDSLTHRD